MQIDDAFDLNTPKEYTESVNDVTRFKEELWYSERPLDERRTNRNVYLDSVSVRRWTVTISNDTLTELLYSDTPIYSSTGNLKRDTWDDWATIQQQWTYLINLYLVREWNTTWYRFVDLYKNWSPIWNSSIYQYPDTNWFLFTMQITKRINLITWDYIWVAVRQTSWWDLDVVVADLDIVKLS